MYRLLLPLTVLLVVATPCAVSAQDNGDHDHGTNHDHGDGHDHGTNGDNPDYTDLDYSEEAYQKHGAEVDMDYIMSDANSAKRWQLAGAIINFVLLMFIFVKFGKAPISNFLKERRRSVEDGLEEARAMKEAAEAKHAEYSGRLEKLDSELASIRKEMISAGESERDRIVAEAESKAARIRKETQFLIDQQMKQLRKDLTEETAEAAVEAAKQALATQTSKSDQQRLADEYLKSLQDMAGGAS